MKVLRKLKRGKPSSSSSSSPEQETSSPGEQDAEESGILVGHSLQNGQQEPVYLPSDALEHHTLVVGCLNTGKTTLLEHLTVAAMERGYGVVVIDSHDDLVPALLKRVPQSRVGDVYWLDVGYTTHGAGLNWLDVTAADHSTIVNGFVHAAPRIWKEFWSPHLEDALRASVRTLLAANETLVKWCEPQFTCQDLDHLFFREDFRRLLLDTYVHDHELRLWWSGFFDQLPENHRQDLMGNLLGRWQVFVQPTIIAKSVAQPNMDIPLSIVHSSSRILLVNQKTESMPDLGRSALSSLILHRVLSKAVRPNAREDPHRPPRLLVVMNGAQALPDLETLWRMGEFRRAGVSFFLSAQSLCAIPEQGVAATLFANVENLFVFRTTGHDAKLIALELNGTVDSQTVSSLSDYQCFLRTRRRDGRPQSSMLETLPPGIGDEAIAAAIQKLSERYTRPRDEVEAEHRASYDRWSEREATYRQEQERLQGGEEDGESSDDQDDSEPSPMKCDP